MNKELSKQSKVVDKAEKYQKEQDKILTDNEELINTVKKFNLPSEDAVIRDFEKESHTFIDAEKQIKHEKNIENEFLKAFDIK